MTKSNKNDANELCDIRKGIMFYFFENPNKDEIKKIYNEFCRITNAEFKYYFINKGYYKKVSQKNLFNKWLENTKFDNSEIIEMTDATKDKLQQVKIHFALSDYNEMDVCNLPNTIYLECPVKISWNEIYKFILEASKNQKYYYICSNYVVGKNSFLSPKSMSKGIEMLRNTNVVNDRYSVWENFSFMMNMKSGIDGPNFIQILSKKLYENIDINFLKVYKENLYRYTINNDYLILDLVNEEKVLEYEELFKQYKKMYSVLKPIILQIKKPKMYWKDEQWSTWVKRFED